MKFRIALIAACLTLYGGYIGACVAGGVTENTNRTSQFLRGTPVRLVASWYSIQSLKNEGTYKYSKGVMANGEYFQDNLMVCACRIFPIGTWVRITNLANNKKVICKVTDKIGKRFSKKRIDLSKRAFSLIADLKQGIVSCKVEKIK